MTQLVLFRAVQGIGAGGLFPLSLAVIGNIVPPRDRGKWQGLIGAVFAASSIIGPAVGGFIVDNASWRWIFFVNLPVGGLALIVISITMPRRAPLTDHTIDWLGAGLLAAGTGALLLGLVWGGQQYAWTSRHVIGALTVSAVLLAAFAFVERRAREPILPFEILRNPIVAGSVACMALVGMVMFGTISYVPLFVQGVIGTSAASSGVVLTPLTLGAVVTSLLTGQLISRTGHYRWNVVLGPVVLTIGMLLLWRMGTSTTNAEAARNMVIAGHRHRVDDAGVRDLGPERRAPLEDRLRDRADAIRPSDGRDARGHDHGRDREPRASAGSGRRRAHERASPAGTGTRHARGCDPAGLLHRGVRLDHRLADRRPLRPRAAAAPLARRGLGRRCGGGNARDGRDRLRSHMTDDFMPLDGWDHVELWVGNAKQAAYYYEHAFGFRRTAYAGPETGVRDRASYVLEQNEIRLVVTSALRSGTAIGRHASVHGDGVKDIALRVPDASVAFREAVARGAEAVVEPHVVEDDFGKVELATIATYGEIVHTFVGRNGYEGAYLPGYVAQESANGADDGVGLLAIDHIVGNVELGRMEHWVAFYEQVFGMTEMIHFSDDDISTEYSALMSKVMTDGQGKVKFPINEPAEGKRKSQIDEYLEFNEGPGAQHIALQSSNIVKTVEALQRRGVMFLTTPDAYYEDTPGRVGEIDESWDDLRRLKILADRDDDGYLLQIFTKTAQDRPTLFFEVIERHGARGFGDGNFKALFEAIEREQALRGNL